MVGREGIIGRLKFEQRHKEWRSELFGLLGKGILKERTTNEKTLLRACGWMWRPALLLWAHPASSVPAATLNPELGELSLMAMCTAAGTRQRICCFGGAPHKVVRISTPPGSRWEWYS